MSTQFQSTSLVRQWQILRLLEGRGYSVLELMQAVHVPRGLIRHDLLVIEQAGFPIYDNRDDDGVIRWRVLRTGVRPQRAA